MKMVKHPKLRMFYYKQKSEEERDKGGHLAYKKGVFHKTQSGLLGVCVMGVRRKAS